MREFRKSVRRAAVLQLSGMEGQPVPSEDTLARLRLALRQFELPDGDRGKARPDLFLLVERDPTANLTELLAPALSDDAAFSGLAATFSDALEMADPGSARANYLRYNLIRLFVLRSRLYPLTRDRMLYLDRAAKLASEFPESLRDRAVWELKGDIDSERGDLSGAVASYKRISTAGGGPVLANYKIALAYQKARRWREAEQAYTAAAQADAASGGGGQFFHYIYQGLGGLYLEQRREKEALAALERSVRIKPAAAGGVRLRVELAQALLQRGYRRQVAEYARAALKVTPDDPALEELKLRAEGR